MENVNKQLLDALVGMVGMWKATCDAMGWERDHLVEYDIARKAIAAAEQAAKAEPVAMSLPFFAYDNETGFERFATEAKAKAAAQESIDAYREEAGEEWAEEVENICWGVVLGTTREVALPDEYIGGNGLADSMKPVDYVLTDATQPPAVAVPDEMESVHYTPFMSADTEPEIAYRDGWNACRDVMLAAMEQQK